MILKDISFSSPQENILFDDVLLFLAEQGQSGEVLRFWESAEYFIVLGKIGQVQQDIKMAAARGQHILVLRRSSGGGTVVQGKGCLNFSLVLDKAKHPEILTIHSSYRFILEKIVQSLKDIKIDAVFKPISDIATVNGEKKFSGNAQRRARKFILHHGTILYDFDLTKIETFLKIPEHVPTYRADRSHRDFVTNIAIAPDQFKKMCGQNFGVDRQEPTLTSEEKKCLAEFLRTKNISVALQDENFGFK